MGYGDAHRLMSMQGVGIAIRRPRAFEEAHHWNMQAKFYNENSH